MCCAEEGRHPLPATGIVALFGTEGGRHPPRAPDVYVSSKVSTLLKEPRYCIMYASGQQPGRAGGPGKSPGPPKGSPKGERTTGRGMSAG